MGDGSGVKPWPQLTWHRPSPAAHSRTHCPLLSARRAASHSWWAAGRPPRHPTTPRTARTGREHKPLVTTPCCMLRSPGRSNIHFLEEKQCTLQPALPTLFRDVCSQLDLLMDHHPSSMPVFLPGSLMFLKEFQQTPHRHSQPHRLLANSMGQGGGCFSPTWKWKIPAYLSWKLWSLGTTRARISSFRVREAIAAKSQQSPVMKKRGKETLFIIHYSNFILWILYTAQGSSIIANSHLSCGGMIPPITLPRKADQMYKHKPPPSPGQVSSKPK